MNTIVTHWAIHQSMESRHQAKALNYSQLQGTQVHLYLNPI